MYSGDKLESKKLKQSQNENDVILTFREKIRQILCKFPLITTSWACSEIEKGIIILFFFKFRQHYFCNIWHAILRSVPMCPIWDMYCSCNTLWMLVYIVKKMWSEYCLSCCRWICIYSNNDNNHHPCMGKKATVAYHIKRQ